MPLVKLHITGSSTTDLQPRNIGISIDKPLPDDFFISQPESFVGITFKYVDQWFNVDIPTGEHTVYIGIDAPQVYKWRIEWEIPKVIWGTQDVYLGNYVNRVIAIPAEPEAETLAPTEVVPEIPIPVIPIVPEVPVPIVPTVPAIPSLPWYVAWLQPVLDYGSQLTESVVNFFAPIFAPLGDIGKGIIDMPKTIISGIVTSISAIFKEATDESIKSTLETAKSVTGHTPEWKQDLDATLKPYADDLVKQALEQLSHEKIGKSSLTPQEAATAAAGIGTTVTGLGIGLWLAHAAAEAASLGQYEAIHDLDDMVIAKLGLGVLSAKALSIPLDQLVFKRAEQFYASQFTPEIPAYADIINMVVKEVITLDNFKDVMKYLGYNEEWSQRIWDAHFFAPNWTQILQAYYRGIVKKEELDKLGILVDLDPRYKNIWDAQIEQIPSYSELTNELVKEVIDLPTYEKYLQWLGYDKTWAKRIWDAHFIPPSFGDILTAWRRGTITETDVDRLMILVDLDPRFKNVFDTRKYVDPSISLARFMFETQAIDTSGVENIVLRNGYNPEDTKAIVDFIVNFQERLWRRRYLVTLASGVTLGAVTEDELTREVVEAGYTKGVAEWMLKTTNMRKEITTYKVEHPKEKILSVRDLRKAYILDKITSDVLRTELLTRGYEIGEVDLLISLMDYDKHVTEEGRPVVALSIGQMLNAYRYNEINRDELLTKLQLRGLALDESETLIKTKEKQWRMIE